MSWVLLLLGVLLGAQVHVQAQQVSILNITAPYYDFSPTCIQVLNQAVSCDPKILDAGRGGKLESDQVLKTVCTTDCANSLTTWVRRVVGACGQSRYIDGKASVLAAFLGQTRLEEYSVLCLKNTQGHFCNAALRSAISSAGTATTLECFTDPGLVAWRAASGIACHTCAASIISTRLQMPIGATQAVLKSQYDNFTSSCRISSMSVTPLGTTTSWVSIAPTAVPQCNGTVYTIKKDDNCRSVSLAGGIATTELLAANGLQAFCADFPASGTVCIPSARACKPHQLKADLTDTCASVARKYAATWVQIVSWNPAVGEYCENIGRLSQAGLVICVSTPGGSWVNPFPQPPEVTTTEPETYFTLPPTAFASAPSAALAPTSPYGPSGFVFPIANGSVLDCYLLRPPPVKAKANSSEDSYRCSDYARFYGATIAQLLEWNPSLAARTAADGDCTLWPGEQYCARRDRDSVGEVASGATQPYCVAERVAEAGTRGSCDGFVVWYGLNMGSFLEWNPGLGPSCAGFLPGTAYCTDVRNFRPAGTISTCTRWHMAVDVKPANNPCGIIEQKYGLTHARFVAWNPSIKNDCSGIRLYYDYCVGTPQFPGTGG